MLPRVEPKTKYVSNNLVSRSREDYQFCPELAAEVRFYFLKKKERIFMKLSWTAWTENIK